MLKKEFQKKYSCEFCHKRFPTPSKLQRHQLVHSGEKPYLCFICLKGFTQRVHLNTHKKHAHPQTVLDNPPPLQLANPEDAAAAVADLEEEPPLAIAQHWVNVLQAQVILYDWKNCDQLRGENHNKFCFSSYYSLAC